MNEEWREVAGYVGLYEVSDVGRVRSLERLVKQKGRAPRLFPGIVLSQSNHSTGYKQLALSKEGVVTGYLAHRIVAAAFCDNPLGMNEVNHIDTNKANNAPANLEWCTHKQNQEHASKKGRMSTVRGSAKGASKLTEDQAIDIKIMLSSGFRVKDIHAKYPFISRTPIYEIKNGTSWAHV